MNRFADSLVRLNKTRYVATAATHMYGCGPDLRAASIALAVPGFNPCGQGLTGH